MASLVCQSLLSSLVPEHRAELNFGFVRLISWDDALPGDLVFYPSDDHVGIVGGRDEDGNLLIIHCAFSQNNVVITAFDSFTSIARPYFPSLYL